MKPLLLLTSSFLFLHSSFAESIPVKITPGQPLTREGKPYFIKGGGGETKMDELAQRGGNSLRTWGTEGLKDILDKAQKLNLTVTAGIWLEPECAWFSYKNPAHTAKQTERVRGFARQFRDHPALLFWGLGNEAEGDGRNAAFWEQLDRLAVMMDTEDPAHPTFTAVAGLSAAKADGLNQHAPHLDFVGINSYGGMYNLREQLVKMKWTRPWVVTEFGPQGPWEIGKTSWGAPLEQTSTQKVEMLKKIYTKEIAPGGDCWGSYVFLWGQKQETTSTWFSMFTTDGKPTPSVDAMQELWTGQPPANRAPDLAELASAASGKTVAKGSTFTVAVKAADPEKDPLTFAWSITAETGKRDKEGRELPIAPQEGLVVKANGAEAELRAPDKAGNWRVYVQVSDDKGHAVTGNFPFQVTP